MLKINIIPFGINGREMVRDKEYNITLVYSYVRVPVYYDTNHITLFGYCGLLKTTVEDHSLISDYSFFQNKTH